KIIGPAYQDVAKRYRNAGPGIVETLVKKVRAGGSGNWGTIPMVAHPQLSDAQLHAMVKWVLAH
ncbi:MAG: c-type cytochrome, partial [bacterium]